jgi:peptide deformylase
MEEGCLSLPEIREQVSRQDKIRIKYMDENFVEHDEEYHGFAARIIQHEYDHLEGIMFVDYLSPLKRKLLRGKLTSIARGKISTHYKIRLPV